MEILYTINDYNTQKKSKSMRSKKNTNYSNPGNTPPTTAIQEIHHQQLCLKRQVTTSISEQAFGTPSSSNNLLPITLRKRLSNTFFYI